MSLRPAWAVQLVPGQPRLLYTKALSQKNHIFQYYQEKAALGPCARCPLTCYIIVLNTYEGGQVALVFEGKPLTFRKLQARRECGTDIDWEGISGPERERPGCAPENGLCCDSKLNPTSLLFITGWGWRV